MRGTKKAAVLFICGLLGARTGSLCLWTAALFALSLGASNVAARAIQTSICDLVSRSGFYDGKLVVVRATVRGSGLHAPLLMDRRCMSAPGIAFSEEARARHEHVKKLRSAIREAFFSSTLEAHRYVNATFIGTFIAKPANSSDAELKLQDVYSMTFVKDEGLVPRIPPPPH